VSSFEERLLTELRGLVAAPRIEGGHRRRMRRAPRLALAGGLAAIVATVATAGVFVLSAGTQAAYAVTKNADGSITVQIDSLTDAAGLQAKLQAAGVNAVVEYLPSGKMCKQPWFTPAGAPAAANGVQQSSVGRNGDGTTSFTISGDRPTDATLVVTTQTGPGNEQALGIAWAEGTVPACEVVDAPAGSGPLGGPPTNSSTQSSQG
jgi:FlaG/FlaF family flagellin (archaellin)